MIITVLYVILFFSIALTPILFFMGFGLWMLIADLIIGALLVIYYLVKQAVKDAFEEMNSKTGDDGQQ